jgi:hypothetical protein
VAPRNFAAFLRKSKNDKQNYCGAPLQKKAADFGSRREAVLKDRHRSHHSGGFITEGEAHDYR